jgi:N utilization substance protein A
MLTGWDIDILTEAEESERRSEEFRKRSQMFMEALDVDDVIAHLLVTEGFTEVEEVAFVPLEDIANIEGFDEEVATELRQRARAFLAERDEKLTQRRRELGVEDGVAAIRELTPSMLVALGEAGIKTLDDLADLASDELVDRNEGILRGSGLGETEANAIIMAARAHWFQEGEGATPAADAATAAPADDGAAAEA